MFLFLLVQVFTLVMFHVSDEGYNGAHVDHSALLYLVITKGSACKVLWVPKHARVDMTWELVIDQWLSVFTKIM